jgi:hypothetical protein
MILGILLAFAALFNALMDLSSEGKLGRGWWDKNEGWRYKYKDNDPSKGPKYPGATTFFVLFSDGWHLFQFLFHTSWQLAIAIHMDCWFLSFLLIKFSFSIGFETLYRLFK